MSDLSLTANIYHSSSDYLELLNNFLASVNFAKSKGEVYTDDFVEAIFAEMLDQDDSTPEIELLRSIFERYYREKNLNPRQQFTKILKGLQNAPLDEQTVSNIRVLVELLKFHCAQSYARMKGSKI